MALDDKDRKEVEGIISKLFGVEEGKSVLEALGSATETQINAILNKYDKRQGKDREELTKQLKTLSESLEGLKKKPDDDDDSDDKTDDKPTKKGAESAEVKALKNEQRKLAERLEASEKAAKDEKAQRETLEKATAHRAMLDAVRTKALAKDVGVDPDKIGYLLDHLDHNGALRLNEGKTGYEITVGKDKSGEPIWDTLDDGLPKFVKSGAGAFFLPAVKGAGGGHGGGGGKPGTGGSGTEPTTSVGLIAEGLRQRAAGGS